MQGNATHIGIQQQKITSGIKQSRHAGNKLTREHSVEKGGGSSSGVAFWSCEQLLFGASWATNLSGETSLALQRFMVLLLVGAVMLVTGAEVDARTRGGMATPLHRAAAQGHGEVVKLL
jgi:hypothetical protein